MYVYIEYLNSKMWCLNIFDLKICINLSETYYDKFETNKLSLITHIRLKILKMY